MDSVGNILADRQADRVPWASATLLALVLHASVLGGLIFSMFAKPMKYAAQNVVTAAGELKDMGPKFVNSFKDQALCISGQLAAASEQLKPHGLLAGFHNHKIEWLPLAGGQRIMDILAANTPPEFVLQFDVGTCLEAGADPIAWIKAHPGRIRSVHLKDWAPGPEAQEKGYRVLFGEGVAPWKQILDAVESVGGVEFYLMEQEGSRFSELETAQRCLATWRKMRGTA